MKQWHTITFSANLDQDDIKAINKSFYDAMKESMEISECADLMIRTEYEESRKQKAAADFIEAIKILVLIKRINKGLFVRLNEYQKDGRQEKCRDRIKKT